MAGNTAWNGVLVALDAVLDVRKNLKKGQRLDFRDYQTAIVKKDGKMNRYLLNAYNLLHKSLGYDGVTDYHVVQTGLNHAKSIIDWANQNYTTMPQVDLTGKSGGSFFKSLKFW
jgi:hypothetical protein